MFQYQVLHDLLLTYGDQNCILLRNVKCIKYVHTNSEDYVFQ